MVCPSELQQWQKSKKPGAAATGASGCNRVGGLSTSGSSGEPSPMVGGAGNGPSWYEQVTREDAMKSTSKRKRTDTDQQVPGRPFSLGSEPDRKEAMSAMSMWQAKSHLRRTSPHRPLAPITLISLPLL